MTRFAKLAFAAAALTMTALAAAPASAADITVKLVGKSPNEISTEITKAATRVCRDEVMRTALIDLTSCIEFVYNDAVAQLPPTIVVPKR